MHLKKAFMQLRMQNRCETVDMFLRGLVVAAPHSVRFSDVAQHLGKGTKFSE